MPTIGQFRSRRIQHVGGGYLIDPQALVVVLHVHEAPARHRERRLASFAWEARLLAAASQELEALRLRLTTARGRSVQ